jgi:hypothetical protein
MVIYSQVATQFQLSAINHQTQTIHIYKYMLISSNLKHVTVQVITGDNNHIENVIVVQTK